MKHAIRQRIRRVWSQSRGFGWGAQGNPECAEEHLIGFRLEDLTLDERMDIIRLNDAHVRMTPEERRDCLIAALDAGAFE